MRAWLRELHNISYVCGGARGIQASDPNEVWRNTERGDWMLYYMNALLKSNLPGPISRYGESLVDDIARYVKCPTTDFGVSAWNSNGFCCPRALRRLADRVRRIWPDIPLVV